MNNGDGRAPVTLTGNEPVAQSVIRFMFAFSFFRERVENGFSRFFARHTVETGTIDYYSVFAVGKSVVATDAFYNAVYGYTVFFRENIFRFEICEQSRNYQYDMAYVPG